jgi:hypothetical protein
MATAFNPVMLRGAAGRPYPATRAKTRCQAASGVSWVPTNPGAATFKAPVAPPVARVRYPFGFTRPNLGKGNRSRKAAGQVP